MPRSSLRAAGGLLAGLVLLPAPALAGGSATTGPPASEVDADPPVTTSWVDDWDLPGMKVVYVKNLGVRPIEITSYRLYDCQNVGLFECETDTPSGRTVRPGEQIELVVVGPVLTTNPAAAPPLAFRHTYSVRVR